MFLILLLYGNVPPFLPGWYRGRSQIALEGVADAGLNVVKLQVDKIETWSCVYWVPSSEYRWRARKLNEWGYLNLNLLGVSAQLSLDIELRSMITR